MVMLLLLLGSDFPEEAEGVSGLDSGASKLS